MSGCLLAAKEKVDDLIVTSLARVCSRLQNQLTHLSSACRSQQLGQIHSASVDYAKSLDAVTCLKGVVGQDHGEQSL